MTIIQKGKPMSDLISRQAAIEALGERPIVWTDDDQYTLGERNQYDIDRLAIGTLPSARQWIPISERQPEETNLYWVTVKPIDSEMLEVTQRWYFGRGYGDGWEAELYEPPLAWMPMEWPEPWRGEEKR